MKPNTSAIMTFINHGQNTSEELRHHYMQSQNKARYMEQGTNVKSRSNIRTNIKTHFHLRYPINSIPATQLHSICLWAWHYVSRSFHSILRLYTEVTVIFEVNKPKHTI